MVIWSDIRTVWGLVSSKRCVLNHLDGHLDLYTHGLGVFLIKKLRFESFGWSFGVIYVRPGSLLGKKAKFYEIWKVIWCYIRTAWGSFWLIWVGFGAQGAAYDHAPQAPPKAFSSVALRRTKRPLIFLALISNYI